MVSHGGHRCTRQSCKRLQRERLMSEQQGAAARAKTGQRRRGLDGKSQPATSPPKQNRKANQIGAEMLRTSPGLRFRTSTSSGFNLLDSSAAVQPSGTAFKTSVGAWRWLTAAGMTKEAVLLLFNSVPV